MKKTTIALLMIGAVALSACSRDRYNSATDGANNSGVAGSVNDPTSTAYFNQTIGDRVLFMVDQSTLSPQAQGILDQQAQWLNSNTAYSAIIEGHADEQGTREYNVALGARRASSVQSYLIERGVAPGRLKTVSYGKERPLAICSDESCYQQNRRAVTVLTTGAGT
ncbi:MULTISPECIES: peptidoglycan-associated lipoprotein Pal [Maritimibacter]|jgi:peptidoglycan-associated lipoprotein|uniref:Peptidoglycan-associated lipoprotein n=1 Tax=Maritimibacter alkaliphilus HTCC2654 TaxID=314271 RepID=A3VLU3_9RHOB|nr:MULTISPECIES: peptidoglycan-associated lipoprotein Pal [Maritimibacter]EAQ10778.1 OmpA/MotB family protein [Rhodobacterales bacterium HTCC2654] [Maritimibacter alkaliphilus HTCC2654]MBL6429281.1 peptidoglycan-associated lipoprotein Pal [Maritimibacter sp.]TYP81697.1 peptidoglycan-associated lipoprotein [Maritimibacter alkaliphilus HTCC2654]